MSGHAILTSCHNCGKINCHLNMVDATMCKGNQDTNRPELTSHIHVFVACDDCKRMIWDPAEAKMEVKMAENMDDVINMTKGKL